MWDFSILVKVAILVTGKDRLEHNIEMEIHKFVQNCSLISEMIIIYFFYNSLYARKF